MSEALLGWLRLVLAEPRAAIQSHLLVFSPRRASHILNTTRLFFITGMGRSGTLFLSQLLDKAPSCSAYHELPGDRKALVDAYWCPAKANAYLRGGRGRFIAARVTQSGRPVYGEANSYLRFHVDALQTSWQATILHLVRDGRSVVRSIMNRTAFSSTERDHTAALMPHSSDPLADQWPYMDRFERVCWYWASANEYLLERRLPLVRFEDVVSSYGQFAQQILERLDIDLPATTWDQQVCIPRNVSENTSFPDWEEWPPEQKQRFKVICGSTMSSLGYTL